MYLPWWHSYGCHWPLAITQSNPDVIWAGTGEGNPRNSLNLGAGIYKSLNGGNSWEIMGLENTRNIHLIIEGNDRGMSISRNRGKTWHFMENIPLGQWYHIRMDYEPIEME